MSNRLEIDRGLETEGGVEITSLDSSWTTKAYEFGEFNHLGIQLFWTDGTVTGTLYLDYSCDPPGDGVENWLENNVVSLDGTFDKVLILDANLPITAWRLRWDHISGTADVAAYAVKKRSR
jgi:hypothetical protein